MKRGRQSINRSTTWCNPQSSFNFMKPKNKNTGERNAAKTERNLRAKTAQIMTRDPP